ncbi:MAG: 4-vinyl reductase [Desulfobacteraceae bacterium]|nr:4-vinyl reductase [Desulfobacteraceae bacterium]
MRPFDDLKSKIKFDKNYRILLGIVPMILILRWFFVNIQKELEKAGGLKLAKEVYYRAGFESAYKYCQTLRKAEEIEGSHTVQAYLDSMSLRGWGKFKIVLLDEERRKGVFRLYQSAFGEEYGSVGRMVCHCWPGAMAGAVQEIINTYGFDLRVKGREVKCRARGEDYCEFVVAPIRKSGQEKGGRDAHRR